MARTPAAPRMTISRGTTHVGTAMETLRASLDIIKALTIIAVLGGGLLFFYDNRNELRDLITTINKFEFAGLKAEFAKRSFQEYETQRIGAQGEKGVLEAEHHKMLHLRASWLAPILSGAMILWVDDEPENNNAEIQLLSRYQVKVRFARDNDQAMEELRNRERRFDLVISDLDRRGEKLPAKASLSQCPVYWFALPQSEEKKAGVAREPPDSEKRRATLALWNERSNATPFVGFHLVERMATELVGSNAVYWAGSATWLKVTDTAAEPVESVPPVVFYSQYDQRIASPCSDTITWDTYTFMQSVLDQLEKRRWRHFARYAPPSGEHLKTTGESAAIKQVLAPDGEQKTLDADAKK